MKETERQQTIFRVALPSSTLNTLSSWCADPLATFSLSQTESRRTTTTQPGIVVCRSVAPKLNFTVKGGTFWQREFPTKRNKKEPEVGNLITTTHSVSGW